MKKKSLFLQMFQKQLKTAHKNIIMNLLIIRSFQKIISLIKISLQQIIIQIIHQQELINPLKNKILVNQKNLKEIPYLIGVIFNILLIVKERDLFIYRKKLINTNFNKNFTVYKFFLNQKDFVQKILKVHFIL